jgi:phospholipid/cholesterol/gamma-HCH transport system permease protein
MAAVSPNASRAEIRTESGESGVLRIHLIGDLDAASTADLWTRALAAVSPSPVRLVVRLDEVGYCDGAGIGLIAALRQKQRDAGGAFEAQGGSDDLRALLALHPPDALDAVGERPSRPPFVERIGRATVGAAREAGRQVAFVGELVVAIGAALPRPRRLRGTEILRTMESVGVDAIGIIVLIGFLIGLILGFQSAIPMRKYGAELYVADLVAIVMVRELGPLMTAILLAGRSGAAFAAELGTMKVNEEIDALTTMGLPPVRFLVVPRVLGMVLVLPLLNVFMILTALVGTGIVILSFGYPFATYVGQVVGSIKLGAVAGGFFKAFVFGILVSAIGCLRGLQTRSGALAVGVSTTRAVVSGIILIVVVDGVFAVVYYVLGI